LCRDVTAGIEREFGPVSNDSTSLQRMRGFADSDGHIVSTGATSDHETNYNDSISSGHRRKVVIDGIFNRCFIILHTNTNAKLIYNVPIILSKVCNRTSEKQLVSGCDRHTQ